MLQFDTTINLLGKHLPKSYTDSINEGEEHPFGAEDQVPDVEVLVSFTPGTYYPAKTSGHPDSWEPASGDPPEIDKVELLGDGFVDITKSIPDEVFEELLERCWGAQAEEKENRLYDEAEARLSFMDEGY